MKMTQEQFDIIKAQIKKLTSMDCFYKEKFDGIDVDSIQSQEDFEKLPFTWKGDLREAYPLGLMAVPEEEIVRIHSSSGTTGTPVIIPYTKKDVEDWAKMFARCYELAGITNKDRIHITPGYGLWTAGIGFQLGAERLGAMVIPMGPGNTDKQLQMMMDKMRGRIADELGVELYDIYGLTEVYGPGIGMSCDSKCGMHMWDDYIYFEIVDPKTGEVLPDGEVGELVITTLKKEGAPLIRYRTHDLTRIMTGDCPCGSKYPRIDVILGRTDDMVKVKGVNIFPSQIEEFLSTIEDASSEYQVMIDHLNGKDIFTLFVEVKNGTDMKVFERNIVKEFKDRIGITIKCKPVSVGDLPRSEKKTARIYDNRY